MNILKSHVSLNIVKGEAAVMQKQTSVGGCCVPAIRDETKHQARADTKAGGGCCG